MIKEFVKNHPQLMMLPMHIANILNIKNRLRVGKGNKLQYGNAWLKGLRILCSGKGNTIVISDNSKLVESKILIKGNNNTIFIGKHAYINTSVLTIIGDGSHISFGDETSVNGKGEFAALEGANIDIGRNCMISTEVQLRTGDSHPIYDDEGNRINLSKSIMIGNNVWLGVRTMLLKGTEIADGSIVGAMSLVSGIFNEPNSVIAGVPAKQKKAGVHWKREE